jgi:N-acetylglutamate synthase-like GNAT family acetyltransferase
MMEFRFADESDTPNLLALINQAFSVEAFFHIGTRLDPDRIQPHMRNGRFLVAESGGKLVGCVYVELHAEQAYLGLLSVDPAQQKTGLGRRLVAAVEEFAREMGAHRMDLTVVNLRTELPPYYSTLGYAIVGEEPIPEQMRARVNQPCYFLRMSKALGKG